MRLNTRSKIRSFALQTLSSAVASAVLFSASAYAAGLGKLTVLSSLGQPLNAEIELTAVTAEEASGLVAKLAPAEAFRQANIDYNPALSNLRFSVEQRGSRQYIKITSSQPVNEPFVDMLLELSWNSGRLVREYTFLLDPAEMRTTQPAQVAAPAVPRATPGSTTTSRPATTTTTTTTTTATPTVPRQAPQQAAPAGDTAGEYRVQKGDTLGRIAADIKPVEVSLDMMLVALYRANPDAFVGNNMNRLKSGQILTVPDTATIKGTGAGEARGVVVAHAADFNAYRNKLAGQVASAAPDRAPEASQTSGGKITASVADRRTAATEAQDKLKLSKVDATGKTGMSTEERIAKEKALADATARVKELERNVSELEKLMSVKNKAAADAQKAQAAAVPPAKPVIAPIQTPPPAAKPAPVVVPPPVVAPVVVAPPVAAPPPAPVVTAPVPAPVAETAPAPAPKPAKKPDAVLAATPPGEPGLVDMIMDNLLWIVGGLLALGLAAAVAMGLKKRRSGDHTSPNEPSILGAPTDQAHSLFAETGGQSVDTSNSVFNSSFAPSASQLDTNEVDPVAEADVYIAYGRDAQAEEILKEALRTHPERYPVRLKLLEIYAARKDTRAFETQASELYSLTKGAGDEWAQAAALGLAVDPLNPLYAGAANGGPSTIIPGAEETGQRVVLDKMSDAPTETLHDTMADLPTDLAMNDTTAVPAPAAAPAQPVDDLDFDLGGLSFAPSAPAAPAVPAATLADANDMDFTLPASAPAAAAPVAAKADQSFDMDFNMDFDKPAAAPAAKSNDLDLDIASNDFTTEFANSSSNDLSGMGDLASAFDIPKAAAPAAAPALDNSLDLDSMNFDLPSSPAKSAPAPSFDMASIDLDLPGNDTAAATLPDVGGSASHTEMETKLDLAIAYQEIGDKEGARELLDEVIKGGSGEQVSKANEMRAKLA